MIARSALCDQRNLVADLIDTSGDLRDRFAFALRGLRETGERVECVVEREHRVLHARHEGLRWQWNTPAFAAARARQTFEKASRGEAQRAEQPLTARRQTGS